MRLSNAWRRRIAYTILVAGMTAALLGVQVQNSNLCHFQRRSWDTSHQQIVDDAKPQPVTDALLRTIPAFRAFATPGTPEYSLARSIARSTRDRHLRVLGDRPDC